MNISFELPLTEIERFDQLVFGTLIYDKWRSTVEKKGFFFVEKDLGPGNAAHIDLLSDKKVRKQLRGIDIREISKKAIYVILIDCSHFRYIDLLHESRHISQIIRANKQDIMLDKYNAPLFELGAYHYEQKLAQKFGFSNDYKQLLSNRINDYEKTVRSFRRSETFRHYEQLLWR